MKTKRPSQPRAERNLKFGGYAALITAVFLALLIAISILAGGIPLRVDLTIERYFTLSEQTNRILDGLSQPVRLVALYETGKEDPRVDELLKKYRSGSSRIQLSYIDPYYRPLELKRYEVDGQVPTIGSLVVDSGARFRVIKATDLYGWTVDVQTKTTTVQNFQAEQVISSAILYTITEKIPVLYLVKGHGETDIPAAL